MPRHEGILPDTYKQKLRGMTLHEIAAEAARLRSDGKRCGTATALILRWTIQHKLAPGARSYFLNLYSNAWLAEKAARAANLSGRPEDRPAKGGQWRARRDSRIRHGFAHSY
ncbi:MAG: hypothetical protein ACREGG_02885 [Candidatus Saccharimonadales bacterium]